MKQATIRTTLFTILIGSLVAAAGVGVTAVLIGGFNDILGRALWTIFLAVFHSLIALGYLVTVKNDKPSQVQWSKNALFGSIMVSFLATVLGTWDVISGDHVWNTYQALFIIHFAIFHSEVLATLLRKNKVIDVLVYVNYAFIAIVVAMLTVIIYADGNDLGELFSRILGASAIIDGTLTLIVIILDRMFAPKQAQVAAHNGQPAPTKSNDLLLIFVATVLGVLQLFGGFFWVLFI